MISFEKKLYNFHLIEKMRGGYPALAANYMISQFALGLVNLFGIVFIFTLGNNFNESVALIFIYYGLQRLVVLLSIYPVGRIVSKIGYRWPMFVALLFMSIKFLLLSFVTKEALLFLIPSLIFGGIAIPSYYLPFHAIFLDDNNDHKIGEQIGLITMLGRLAVILSPIVAGLIVSSFGFSTLFVTVFFILLVSVFPLFMMNAHKRHEDVFSFGKIVKFLKRHKKTKNSMLAWTFSVGVQDFYWVAYFFLIVDNYKVFGMVGGFVMLLNSLGIFIAGKAYDKRRNSKLFLGSSLIVAVSWIGRFASPSVIPIIIFDSIARFSSPAWWMKIRRRELVAGEGVDSLVFGAAHEYLTTLGYLGGLLVSYLVLTLSGGVWAYLSIPGVVAIFYSTYLLRKK